MDIKTVAITASSHVRLYDRKEKVTCTEVSEYKDHGDVSIRTNSGIGISVTLPVNLLTDAIVGSFT